MPLPVIFASLSNPTLSQLDANFNALGAISPVPCSVSGTNTLTLTPLANTPTISGYQNYQQFTGIASATSSGLINAQVGANPLLNVYADSSTGVAQAGSGAIVQKTAFTLMYDSTLNAGAGGFHLLSAVAVGSFLPLAGGTLSGVLVGTSVTLSGALTAASGAFSGAVSGGTVSATGVASGATVSAATLFSGASITLSGAGSFGTSITVGGSASVGKLGIAAGQLATRMLWTTATLTFSAINPNSSNDQTITLAGVAQGDTLLAGVPSAPTAGIVLFPYCATTGTVVMRALNGTTATLTPPSGVYEVTALGFT